MSNKKRTASRNQARKADAPLVTRRQARLLPVALGVAILSLAAAVVVYRSERAVSTHTFAEGYADPATCATCHAKIARDYQQTGMGRSFRRVAAKGADVDLLNQNVLVHQASGKTYRMLQEGEQLVMRRETVDPGDGTAVVYSQSMDYVIGSGNHARTYLHRTPDNKLMELPVSWYTELGGRWEMSPGYDRASQMDFRRPIGKDCMFCHNGYPSSDPVASSRADGAVFPAELPEGIDCQRCHGPGEAHVRAAKAWRAKPETVAATILNPADLPRERQMDVCRQCHLETTSLSLPNAIRRFDRGAYSYRPGQALTDFQIFFDHKAGSGFEDRVEVAHQAYRLEKSQCYRKSQMTCTTCHDPHRARRGEDARKHYLEVCVGCHQSEHPKLASQPQVTPASDCLKCHMWKRRTDDVVHVVMTDHFIQRDKPEIDLLAPRKEQIPEYRGRVEPYYPKLLSEMPQGVLYDAVAQVAADSNAEAGIPLLRASLEQATPKQAGFYLALAEAYVRQHKDTESIPWFELALKQPDAQPLDRREMAVGLAHAGELQRATVLAQEAATAQPADLVALTNLANMYLQAGRIQEARQTIEKALAVNGEAADAANILGLILVREGRPAEAQAAFRRALMIEPDLAEARANLATTLAEQGDMEQARKQMEAVIRANTGSAELYRKYAMMLAGGRQYGDAIAKMKEAIRLQQNPSAIADLGDLLVAAGRIDEAVTTYREAVRLNVREVRAHLGLASILMVQNRTAEAEREYQAAAEAAPRNGEAQMTLAEIAMRRGDALEARRRLQLAAQSDDAGAREAAERALRGVP